MRVVILCGGRGTRIADETDARPKPMVEIGGRPILWHIMKLYSVFGFTEFVLALGYRGDAIREYFLNYAMFNSDVRVHLADQRVERLGTGPAEPWTITLAETGLDTPTAGRVRRVKPYLDGERFMVTYGDGLADLDIGALVAFHLKAGRLATVTGVHPVARFGELRTDGDIVAEFAEKPQTSEGLINGGFFVFETEALQYFDATKMLEREPLERLARDGQLAVYRHGGYWRAMDTLRERQALEEEWASGRAPWKRW